MTWRATNECQSGIMSVCKRAMHAIAWNSALLCCGHMLCMRLPQSVSDFRVCACRHSGAQARLEGILDSQPRQAHLTSRGDAYAQKWGPS